MGRKMARARKRTIAKMISKRIGSNEVVRFFIE
jgi:hypothetical protein